MSVDWSKPIEAVHTDGRVVPFLEDNGISAGFFRMDGTHKNPRIRWRIRNVAEEVKMGDGVKFKVGDRVRHRYACDSFSGGKPATVYAVGGGYVHARLDNGVEGAGRDENWELIDDPADELAQLRAFKEQAIARYPDLGEPESDEAAVERLAYEYRDDQIVTIEDLVTAAIAWARANPR